VRPSRASPPGGPRQPADRSRQGYQADSVERTLELLLAFESVDRISVSEASELLGVSRSSAHRLLGMLQYRGFVRQDPRTRSYMGGPALLRMGLAALRRLEIRAAVGPIMQRVVEEINETAHLVVLQGADALFLDCVEGNHAVRAAARTGTSLPAHCTAGGKALLARMAPDARRALLGPEVIGRALTPRSLTSSAALERELERIARRGYALNDEESEPGLRAVAAAIPSSGPGPAPDMAITVSGPASRLDAARLEAIGAMLVDRLSTLG